jgi:hypothetical protein
MREREGGGGGGKEASKMGGPGRVLAAAPQKKMVSTINYFCETFYYCASIYT